MPPLPPVAPPPVPPSLMAATGADPALPRSSGSGPAALEIDEFEDVALLLEAEQRQQQRGWWSR